VRVKNYDTTLFNDKFSYKVTNNFKNNSLTFWDDRIERCITYNTIIDEMTELGYATYISELKYRLDDNESINEILMSIITRNNMLKSTLGYHRGVIQMYLDQDFMSLFK
jgi:hypothetical protein